MAAIEKTYAELLNAAEAARLCKSQVRAVGAMLPEKDFELEALLEYTVDGLLYREFETMLLAALDAGREVDARFLRKGINMLSDVGTACHVAVQCAGDVGEVLVEAARDPSIQYDRRAAALLAAAVWNREHRPDRSADDLVREARALARRQLLSIGSVLLWALAEELADESLKTALRWAEREGCRKGALKMLEDARVFLELPVLTDLPDEPEGTALSGYTVRRAVQKIGRNEPCHCGSGRKYKKCCLDKDKKRLADSSEISGVTRTELRRSPEIGLTRERLLSMPALTLARLDPLSVPDDLREVFLSQLNRSRQLYAVAGFYEKVGYCDRYKDHAFDSLEEAAGQKDQGMVRRIVAACGGREAFNEDDIPFSARFYLTDAEPGELLRMLEGEALDKIDEECSDFAHHLLSGPCPALGIHVARGIIQSRDYCFDAPVLLEALLEARDRLDLPPEDPFEEGVYELFDRLLESDDEQGETEDQREELRAATEQVRSLRRELDRQKVQLEQREKELEAAAKEEPEQQPPSAAAVAEAEKQVRQLRSRVVDLKGALSARHEERNHLRRELDGALHTLAERREEERGKGAAAVSEDTESGDEAVELPNGALPARVPVFPEDFARKASRIPRGTYRAAIALVGRMAAGERAAFREACHLRRDRKHLRQRVGLDYRLLFTMDDTTLTVVDLVHRQDLERRVRTLLR